MRKCLRPLVSCSILLIAGGAWAEDKSAKTPKAAPSIEGGVRKDPKGVKGISPFWEALKTIDKLIL